MAKKKHVVSTKLQLLVATGIVLLLVAFGLFIGWLDVSVGKQSDDRVSVTLQDITLKGESVCLSHKGDGVSTLECGVGIKVPSGAVYAVSGEGSEALSGDNKNLEVTGTLTIPGDSAYKSDGTLTLKK